METKPTPPYLPTSVAKKADIHLQTLSQINRGVRAPSIKLGAILSRIAREVEGIDGDIVDWVPALQDPEVWKEIIFAVDRRRSHSSDLTA